MSDSYHCIGESCHNYHFCRDKTFVATNTCFWHVCGDKHVFVETEHVFVAAKIFCRDKRILLRQMICREKHTFIMGGSCHKYNFACVCRDKHVLVGTKHVFCRDKSMLVTTKLLLQQKRLMVTITKTKQKCVRACVRVRVCACACVCVFLLSS